MSILSALTALPAALPLAQSNNSGGGLSLIFLLLPVAMIAFLIIPQRKQRKEQAAMLSKLGVGDEVVTASGLYGHINFIEPDTGIVHLEVDTDVVVRVSKSSVARSVSAPQEAPTGADEKGSQPADGVGSLASKLFNKK